MPGPAGISADLWLDAKRIVGPFDPSSLNPVAWYEAEDIAGNDGDSISTWADRSGNGYDLSQTGVDRPILKHDILNDGPVVRFDGTSQFLKITSSDLGLSGTDEAWTFVVVYKADVVGSNRTVLAAGDVGNNQEFFQLKASNGTPNFEFSIRDDAGTTKTTIGGTPDTNWHVLVGTTSGTAGNLYLDNLLIGSANQDMDVGALTLNTFSVGALNRATPASFFDGDIAAVLLFNSVLSDTNRNKLIQYYGVKHALGVKIGYWHDRSGNARHMDPAHPYATDATKPTYAPTGVNSLPAVSFDGTDDLLGMASNFGGAFTAATIVAVFTRPTGTTTGRNLVDLTGATNTRAVLRSVQAGSDAIATVYGTGAATYSEEWVTPGAGPLVVTAVVNNTGAISELYGGGTLRDSASGTPGVAANSIPWCIGNRLGGGQSHQGYLTEVAVFLSELSDADREAVEEELASNWGETTSGSGLADPAATTGFEHYFGNTSPRTLPDLAGSQFIAQFQTRNSVAGGYISASGIISPAEFAAYPSKYAIGQQWLVKDTISGEYVFGGWVSGAEESGGVVQLTAEGWGRAADREIQRFLALSYNLDMWVPGDQEPFGLTNWARIAVEMKQNGPTWRVEAFTSFRKHKDKIGSLNGKVGTLDANISNTTTTSITVNEDHAPHATPFYVKIGTEKFKVTNRAGGSNPRTYTVVRGAHGTDKSTHTAGANVIEYRAIDDNDTTIYVDEDVTPPGTPFTATIDYEQVRVTNRTGGSNPRTYTVTRGYNSTNDAPHDHNRRVFDTSTEYPTEWKSDIVCWTPGTNLKYIAFNINKNHNDNDYTLELLGIATGPTGAEVSINTWSMGAGGPSSVSQVIGGNYDMLILRMKRSTETRRAKRRWFKLTNLRVGNLSQDDSYTLTEAFEDIFDKLSITNQNIATSAKNVAPYDAERIPVGQIADEMSIFGTWFWRVWATTAGVKVGEAGPFSQTTWNVTDTHSPVRLISQERWNKVRFEYEFTKGYFTTKTVTASPNPFPGGYDKTFALQLDEPPPETIATLFAQEVANYLSTERRTGTAIFSAVENPGNPGVSLPPTKVRPGDGIRLTNYSNKVLTVASIDWSQDGKVATVEFTTGNPMLDKMLAERVRLLSRGRNSSAATLGALNPEEPAAPLNVDVDYVKMEQRNGEFAFNAYLTWDPVTDDVDGNGTFIKSYDVRWRPTDSGGTPIDREDGGGWRHKIVRGKRDDDDLEVDPPERTIVLKMPHPRKWYWEWQVRAIDLIGQEGAWSTTTGATGKPAQEDIEPVTGLTVEIAGPHRVHVDWDAPIDPDDPDATLKTLSPAISHFQCQVAEDAGYSTNLKSDRVIKATRKNFHYKKTRGKTFYARVRAVDAYGNKSVWVEANNNENEPTAPQNLAIQYLKEDLGGKRTKLALKASWDELVFADADLDRYVVQLESAAHTDTTFTSAIRRRVEVDVKRDDDTNHLAERIFHSGIRRHRIYRFRVRAITAAGVRGAWSGWFPSSGGSSPLDSTKPPSPLLVTIGDTATDRVVMKWDDPTIDMPTSGTVSGTSGTATVTGSGTQFNSQVQPGSVVKIDSNTYTVKTVGSATSLVLTTNLSTSPTTSTLYIVEDDPEVQFYQIQLAKAADVTPGTPDVYNAVYARDRSGGNRRAFRIPAADKGVAYFGRVRSVDGAYNKSNWIAGTKDTGAGNSSDTAGGDSVVIGAAGSGKTKVVWHVFGRVRVLAESVTHDYDMDEGLTLVKVRVRCKDAPTGQSIKVTPYKNGVALAQITLPANDKRVAKDDYNTAFGDSDRLSFSVDQVGSTFPGKQMTVIAVFNPT